MTSVRERATGSGKGQSSSKKESPKKVKRVKAAARTVLGRLPLYSEQLPDNGSADLPPAARQTCSQLRSVFERVRELKPSGSSDAKVPRVVCNTSFIIQTTPTSLIIIETTPISLSRRAWRLRSTREWCSSQC